MESKSNHRVNVVRIGDIRKHNNADSLGIVDIGGYQVVVRLADWKRGDLGIYIQPDSVVPEHAAFAFLWKDKEVAPLPVLRALGFEVPLKYRRIKSVRLRKEWSEGLLMPVSDFPELSAGSVGVPYEGQDVAEALGITHYEPPEIPENTQGGPSGRPRSFHGWMYFILDKILATFGIYRYGKTRNSGPRGERPTYDVEAYKNFKKTFADGEMVVVTEKLHGSNARYTFDGKKMFVGSRRLWKSPKSNCIWRKVLATQPWIEKWCRDFPGFTLYGEVFPTQTLKGGIPASYGLPEGEVGFRVFDILYPNGEWGGIFSVEGLVEEGWEDKWVPILYVGPYHEDAVKAMVDGVSTMPNAKHIREGIVIESLEPKHVRGLGRAKLKIVSNNFLEIS